jgi:hypothetical protein
MHSSSLGQPNHFKKILKRGEIDLSPLERRRLEEMESIVKGIYTARYSKKKAKIFGGYCIWKIQKDANCLFPNDYLNDLDIVVKKDDIIDIICDMLSFSYTIKERFNEGYGNKICTRVKLEREVHEGLIEIKLDFVVGQLIGHWDRKLDFDVNSLIIDELNSYRATDERVKFGKIMQNILNHKFEIIGSLPSKIPDRIGYAHGYKSHSLNMFGPIKLISRYCKMINKGWSCTNSIPKYYTTLFSKNKNIGKKENDMDCCCICMEQPLHKLVSTTSCCEKPFCPGCSVSFLKGMMNNSEIACPYCKGSPYPWSTIRTKQDTEILSDYDETDYEGMHPLDSPEEEEIYIPPLDYYSSNYSSQEEEEIYEDMPPLDSQEEEIYEEEVYEEEIYEDFHPLEHSSQEEGWEIDEEEIYEDVHPLVHSSQEEGEEEEIYEDVPPLVHSNQGGEIYEDMSPIVHSIQEEGIYEDMYPLVHSSQEEGEEIYEDMPPLVYSNQVEDEVPNTNANVLAPNTHRISISIDNTVHFVNIYHFNSDMILVPVSSTPRYQYHLNSGMILVPLSYIPRQIYQRHSLSYYGQYAYDQGQYAYDRGQYVDDQGQYVEDQGQIQEIEHYPQN